MKNILYILSFLVTASVFSQTYRAGQSNLLNAKNPEDVGVRTQAQIVADEQKPIDYGYVDDKDILWSKVIWEVIDLDERINFPLLYPVDTSVVGPERRPMFWWLKKEILNKNIEVYDQGSYDGEFRYVISDEDVINLFRQKQFLEEGKESLRDFELFIEKKISAQIDQLGFNPFEDEMTAENQVVLDTARTIFPYTIKGYNKADSPYKALEDSIFTYQMFKGFMEPEPVRTILPGGEETPLTDAEIKDYRFALQELIEEELWVEDVHFYWSELKYEQVKQWLIKGMWYFDKKYSELIYRPIAIAPVTTAIEILSEEDDFGDDGFDDFDFGDDTSVDSADPFADPFADDTSDDTSDDSADDSADPFGDDFGGDDMFFDDTSDDSDGGSAVQKRPLFWVYYPHARSILKKGRVFNDRNSSVSKSFDDIINSRRFNAVIYKEENVYENRYIKDYIPNNAFMRLLESERIKEKIRNFEHDMWSW